MDNEKTRNQCFICGEIAENVTRSQTFFGYFCSCKTCGRYEIDDHLFSHSENDVFIEEKLKSSIYYYLTQIEKHRNKEDYRQFRFITGNVENKEILDQGSRTILSYEDIVKFHPTDMDEQISMILVNFFNRCERPGDRIFGIRSDQQMSHLFFLKEGDDEKKSGETDWWMKTLGDLGYIKAESKNGYVLTLEGWKHANNFAKAQNASKTVFVAMSFAEDLLPARVEIVKAIESAGFVPVVIDTKEHNNQIMPEILYEIRKSRFVVADLTKQRNGVYYEAGYAEGLNIPVIALCRDDDFKNVHFDLKQKNTIQWVTELDIQDRLVKRIAATI